MLQPDRSARFFRPVTTCPRWQPRRRRDGQALVRVPANGLKHRPARPHSVPNPSNIVSLADSLSTASSLRPTQNNVREGSLPHVSVLLLGIGGLGAIVHFFWPGKGFQLGMLSNEKPSAIFRLRGTHAAQSTSAYAVFTDATSEALSSDVTAFMKPLPQVMHEVATRPSTIARQT
ncbi:hypothetical protein C8Q76DRAFT_175063 [Earliella scabrosa]|nr:hypothetical protein C8Q76DRAFT_175063 [Earliella scabrosa]